MTAIFACRPNLLVSNLSATLTYYTGALGFHQGWCWSDQAARMLDEGEKLAPREPGTALVQRDEVQILFTQRGAVGSDWLHFDVYTPEQVDELHREWRDRGAQIDEPPTQRSWGMYEMRVSDPDGHVIRVSAPASTG